MGGSKMVELNAITFAGLRGVNIYYASDRPCQNSGRPQGVSIFFRCNPNEGTIRVVTRDPATGLHHLPWLRVADETLRQHGAPCSNVSLEWQTVKACPACRKMDFVTQPGKCRDDKNRPVEHRLARPCVGGTT